MLHKKLVKSLFWELEFPSNNKNPLIFNRKEGLSENIFGIQCFQSALTWLTVDHSKKLLWVKH